eukprot:283455-Alexandrium_andersonii.AAC.1
MLAGMLAGVPAGMLAGLVHRGARANLDTAAPDVDDCRRRDHDGRRRPLAEAAAVGVGHRHARVGARRADPVEEDHGARQDGRLPGAPRLHRGDH